MPTGRKKIKVVGNIYNLYPQFTQLTDRRRQNTPVTFEHRSGEERRDNPLRPDPKLKNDIGTIKHTFSAFISDKDEFIKQVDKYDNASKNKPINFTDTQKLALNALSPITPIRRISSLPDNIEDGNYARAAGILGLMLVNLPEDTRDLKSAVKQLFKNELPKYDYKNCQAPFSFFRGTFLEPIVNKMGKVGIYLHKWDISLAYTRFGKYLRKVFNIEIDPLKAEGTERFIPKVTLDKSGKAVIREFEVFAYKVEGKPLSKLIGRALLRIPVMSIAALGLLEIPNIIKKVNNAANFGDKFEEGGKQTLKSCINVTSILTGISLIGAQLAKKGPAYSLLGMGIGSVAGSYVSKVIQDKVDNLIDKK